MLVITYLPVGVWLSPHVLIRFVSVGIKLLIVSSKVISSVTADDLNHRESGDEAQRHPEGGRV